MLDVKQDYWTPEDKNQVLFGQTPESLPDGQVAGGHLATCYLERHSNTWHVWQVLTPPDVPRTIYPQAVAREIMAKSTWELELAKMLQSTGARDWCFAFIVNAPPHRMVLAQNKRFEVLQKGGRMPGERPQR
jgi:hypothetical protein